MSNDSNPIGQAAESGIVTSLLTRQDKVIAELDLLEAQILDVIEQFSAQRKSENENGNGNDNVGVIPMEAPPAESAEKKPLPKAA